jgi:predicted nucleic acid-binding Zn ribbon protein
MTTAPAATPRSATSPRLAFERSRGQARAKPSARCAECDAGFQSQRCGQGFCSNRCRMAFHRRRSRRAVDLYDLLMEARFNRQRAGAALSLMSRLAASFKLQDERERGGRKSWSGIDEVINRNPHLLAKVVGRNVAGGQGPSPKRFPRRIAG